MVIFGAGVITGGLVVRQADRIAPDFVRRNASFQRRPPASSLPEGGIVQGHVQRMEFLNRVQRELNLDPDQRVRIEKIISDGQVRTRELWEPAAKQMRQEMQQAREKIRGELTPEQRLRFEELLKQRPPRKPGESQIPERRPRDSSRALSPPGAKPVPPEDP
jgi:Spy/CpxP family protein refolding chaperone